MEDQICRATERIASKKDGRTDGPGYSSDGVRVRVSVAAPYTLSLENTKIDAPAKATMKTNLEKRKPSII